MSEVGQCLQHASTMDRPFGCECPCSWHRTPDSRAIQDLIHGDNAEPAPGPNAPPAGTPLLDPDEINQFFNLFDTNALDGTFESLGSFGSLPAEGSTQLHGVFSSLAQTNSEYIDSPFSSLERLDTGHSNAPIRMEHLTNGLATSNGYLLGPSSTDRTSNLASRNSGFSYHSPSQIPTQGPTRSSSVWQTTPNCIPQTGSDPLRSQRHNGHAVSLSSGQVHSRRMSDTPVTYPLNGSSGRSALTFGSDAAFQAHYYAPPDNLDNMHTMEGRMMGMLAGLEAQPSANNTQPSSPLLNKNKRPRARVSDQDGSTEHEADLENAEPSHSKRPRRMVSEGAAKRDSEPAPTSAARSSRRDRSRPSLASPQHRRRASEGKAARQNLSEKQKQQNHIESEKRRRTHINAGIDDLLQLLPEGTVGSSKCVMLARTVEWLSGLKDGNKRLQTQLDSLEKEER